MFVMNAIGIIIISGVFLNLSLIVEEFYDRYERRERFHTTYYGEAYKFLRVLAIIELGLGLYLYFIEPLPLLLPLFNKTIVLVYHVLICLMSLILGAWLCQKFYDAIK